MDPEWIEIRFRQAVVLLLLLFVSVKGTAQCPSPMNGSLPGNVWVDILDAQLCKGVLNPTFGTVVCTGLISTGPISPVATSTVVNGTTAGTVTWAQTFTGTTYKSTALYFNAYSNTTGTAQTITFTTAYTASPAVIGSCPGGMTANTTTITLPTSMGAPFTGQCILEGM